MPVMTMYQVELPLQLIGMSKANAQPFVFLSETSPLSHEKAQGKKYVRG
jgi:hypothetical protein